MSDIEDRDEIFADIAIEKGLLTPEDVRVARDAQRKLLEVGLKRTLWAVCEERGMLLPEQVHNLKRAMVREGGARVRIAGYEIIDRIGIGGMGQVFRARQVSVNRIVALKILSAGLARDPKYVERFTREARLAARLNHRNIVQVYNFGEDHGRSYLAMELVEGRSVAQFIAQEGRVPVARAVEIGIQAARGMQHAHEQGVIHRDIKPSNLLLHVDGLVKVADLGLARQADEETNVTQTSALIGTPAYMPPEQAQSQVSDERADIYSLGATLFHMVTGRPPYAGATPYEVVSQHVGAPVPSPRDLVPEVPAALDAVLMKMMAKAPEDRYACMEDAAKDLEATQRGETPRAALDSPAVLARRRRRLRRVALFIAAAGAFLLGMGILVQVSGAQPFRLPRQRGQAVILGQLWSADRDMPLVGALVSLQSNGRQARTDEDGRFAVTASGYGEHLLRFEHPGYRPGRLAVDAQSPRTWAGSYQLDPTGPVSRLARRWARLTAGQDEPTCAALTGLDGLRMVSHDPATGVAQFAAPGLAAATRAPLGYYDAAPPAGYSEAPVSVREGEVFFVRTRSGLFGKARVERSQGAHALRLSAVLQMDGSRRFPPGPGRLEAAWRGRAIELTWEGDPSVSAFAVWRSAPDGEPVLVGKAQQGRFLDVSVQPDALYRYVVAADDPARGDSDASEVTAFAGPPGLRFFDVAIGGGAARINLFYGREDSQAFDLLALIENSIRARLFTPLLGGVQRVEQAFHLLASAPADGYRPEDVRVKPGDAFVARTADGRFAKARLRRNEDGSLAVEGALQPDGSRRFPTGPDGLQAVVEGERVRLAWKAAGSASQAIYRVWRHRADGPWEALDRARLAEWTGPRPARPGEYEYGVSAVDASGRGETDRAVAAVRVP